MIFLEKYKKWKGKRIFKKIILLKMKNKANLNSEKKIEKKEYCFL